MTEPNTARLRFRLVDLDPAPQRTIEVPLSMSFKGLHDTIQAAFLQTNSQLFEFAFESRLYGIPFDDDFGGEPTNDAGNARLTKLVRRGVRQFFYTYDIGENWEHLIEVLDLFVAPPDAPLQAFLDGKWRTTPEDVNGPPGFEMFLDALGDPDHEEHDDLLRWCGQPFECNDIEVDIVKIQMAHLAARRRTRKQAEITSPDASSHPVNFRKGPDGLMAFVRYDGADPFSGALYVFRAKRADRVKIVRWDGTDPVMANARNVCGSIPSTMTNTPSCSTGSRPRRADIQIGLEKARGTSKPKRAPRPRKGFAAHLERVEVVIEPEVPVGCKAEDKILIREDVSERFNVTPSRFQVIITRRPKYA